jgi:hypothetical protein
VTLEHSANATEGVSAQKTCFKTITTPLLVNSVGSNTTPTTAAAAQKGFPDNFTLREHVLIFSELKVGKNKPTEKQQEWLELMEAWREFLGVPESNAVVRVWYPEDWVEIVRVLE